LPRMKRETLACLSVLVPDFKLTCATVVRVAQDTHAPWTAHEKMVKWLVPKFENMRPPDALYVKNTSEFVDKIKEIHNMLVSFDVKAIYPSILWNF
jgi:hypothetical protein